MNVTAIISEYNPLHKGHLYHIETARKETGADFCIAIMSGNFVQRGTPAILDKYARAEAALKSGVDLVLELPAMYATASAEYFALGGVALANKLGCVTHLSFGSEYGQADKFMEAANLLINEPEEMKIPLKEALKEGLSYPAARAYAVKVSHPELADILETPNNILGVEYCKALLKLKSKIIPHTLKRQGQDYHSETADEGFASATGIRKLIGNNNPEQETILKAQLPPATYDCLSPYFGHRPLTEDDLSMLLRYKLITENRSHLTEYFGVNKELSNRIYKHLSDFETFSSFAELLKTKNITRTAINRALLHILLDIKAADVQEVTKRGCVDYIRVLGFRKEAAGLLKEFSDIPETPLITNLSAAPVLCEIDIRADQIYQMCASQTYKIPYQNEYQRKMLVV
ncbi:MAG: nucleotidyltransferase [Lachnospiraceae bacterium]|nr:nucleotidyltransferase [Lachnospiraceae bacterium]